MMLAGLSTDHDGDDRPVVHLHLGMPKSGSSAIQHQLECRREELVQAGWIVPRTGLYLGAHYHLVRELREDREWELWPRALEEGNEANSVLISAEGLWFASEAQVDRLAERLRGYRVHAHVYLRRPDRFLGSFYRQRIKGSGRAESFSEFLAVPESSVDYPVILRRWSKHFELRARFYEAVGRAIVEDFVTSLGLPAIVARQESQQLNRTPSDGATRAMWWGNRMLPRSLAALVRGGIQAADPLVRWLGKIPDEPLQEQGRRALSGWDSSTFESFGVPADDWKSWSAEGV